MENELFEKQLVDSVFEFRLWDDSITTNEQEAFEIGFRQGWARRRKVDLYVCGIVAIIFGSVSFLCGFVFGLFIY